MAPPRSPRRIGPGSQTRAVVALGARRARGDRRDRRGRCRDTVTLTPWVADRAAVHRDARHACARPRSSRSPPSSRRSASAPSTARSASRSTSCTWRSSWPAASLAVLTAAVRRRLDARARAHDRSCSTRARGARCARSSPRARASCSRRRPDAMSMLDQVAGLAVPDMADLCIVDLLEPDGTLDGRRRARRRPGRRRGAARPCAAQRPLDPAGEHPVAVAARTGAPQLLRRAARRGPAPLRGSPEHLELMQRLRYRSAIVVPLSARGRTLGVLSLLRFASDAAVRRAGLRGRARPRPPRRARDRQRAPVRRPAARREPARGDPREPRRGGHRAGRHRRARLRQPGRRRHHGRGDARGAARHAGRGDRGALLAVRRGRRAVPAGCLPGRRALAGERPSRSSCARSTAPRTRSAGCASTATPIAIDGAPTTGSPSP